MERTEPLPVVGSSAPRWLRILETTAGLLSAGLIVVAVVLLVAKFVAPSVVVDAVGPQWWRIAVTWAVAVPAELIRVGRQPRLLPLRAALASAVVVAVPVALGFTWWW